MMSRFTQEGHLTDDEIEMRRRSRNFYGHTDVMSLTARRLPFTTSTGLVFPTHLNHTTANYERINRNVIEQSNYSSDEDEWFLRLLDEPLEGIPPADTLQQGETSNDTSEMVTHNEAVNDKASDEEQEEFQNMEVDIVRGGRWWWVAPGGLCIMAAIFYALSKLYVN